MRAIVTSGLMVVSLAAGTRVEAQTTRDWVGAPGASWFTDANWYPAGVPAENDTLLLDAGDHADATTFTVVVNDGGEVFLDAAMVDFGLLTIGSDAAGSLTASGTATATSVSWTRRR
jgi:hypothetical protein